MLNFNLEATTRKSKITRHFRTVYALYVDKASHFKTTRYGGLHVNIAEEQEQTHIERALKELDINLILAGSPQAKGRIERLFAYRTRKKIEVFLSQREYEKVQL